MRRALLLFLAFAAACGGATPSGSTTTTTANGAGESAVTNPGLTGTWRWGHGRGAHADGTMTLVVEGEAVRGVMVVEATREASDVHGTLRGDHVSLVRRVPGAEEHIEATIDANGLSGMIDAGVLFWAIRSEDTTVVTMPDGGTAIAPPPPPPPTSDAGAVIITSLPLDGGYVVGTVVPIPGEDGGVAVAPSPDAGRVVVQHIRPPPPPPPPPSGCNCALACYCGGAAPGPEHARAQQACAVAHVTCHCPYCPPGLP